MWTHEFEIKKYWIYQRHQHKCRFCSYMASIYFFVETVKYFSFIKVHLKWRDHTSLNMSEICRIKINMNKFSKNHRRSVDHTFISPKLCQWRFYLHDVSKITPEGKRWNLNWWFQISVYNPKCQLDVFELSNFYLIANFYVKIG